MSIDTQITDQAFASIREALACADNAPAKTSKAVLRSAEFERIKALPVRDPYAYGDALITALTSIFAKRSHNDFGESVRLLESQAIALYEINAFNGFVGNITMGGGKTLVSFLACAGRRGLVVLPAKLVQKTRDEMKDYAKNWRIPGNITLISYEKLSRVNQATFLEDLKPEIVICDEAQHVKNPKTSTHRRIRRYLQKSKAAFVAISGTLIGEVLSAWAPLAAWALHQRSPAPLTWAGQAEWASALAREPKINPGALRDFGEDYREGYSARVAYSPGAFITRGSGVPNALEIERIELNLSQPIRDVIGKLEETWELPTGETLIDPLSFHRAMRQVELGCYYRWTEQPSAEWRECRLNWSKAVREVIRYSRHLDTEQAVINAIDNGSLPDIAPILMAWRAIRGSFTIKTECIWLDRDPVKQIAARARDGNSAIIWLHHTEIGAAFEAEGISYYGAGGRNAAGQFIESADGKQSIAASIASNSEGRNLQRAFGRSIVAELLREPLGLEQLIARVHRPGQPRDCVEIEINTSTDAAKRAWLRVLERSLIVQKNSRQPQRLLLATHVNPLTDQEKKRLE